jgi:hypothetical protein
MVNRWKKKKVLYIIIILITFTVIAGYGSIVYAAPDNSLNVQARNEISLLDPFLLNTIVLTTQDGSNEVVSRPAVRITYRPPYRSYFRPPLVVAR